MLLEKSKIQESVFKLAKLNKHDKTFDLSDVIFTLLTGQVIAAKARAFESAVT